LLDDGLVASSNGWLIYPGVQMNGYLCSRGFVTDNPQITGMGMDDGLH
jgi:hypothetical protein